VPIQRGQAPLLASLVLLDASGKRRRLIVRHAKHSSYTTFGNSIKQNPIRVLDSLLHCATSDFVDTGAAAEGADLELSSAMCSTLKHRGGRVGLKVPFHTSCKCNNTLFGHGCANLRNFKRFAEVPCPQHVGAWNISICMMLSCTHGVLCTIQQMCANKCVRCDRGVCK
jgi:hypothetical protein